MLSLISAGSLTAASAPTEEMRRRMGESFIRHGVCARELRWGKRDSRHGPFNAARDDDGPVTATDRNHRDAIYMKWFLFFLLASGGILTAADKPERDAGSVEKAVALQIFLDRANFGPGKVDGRLGEFTE